MNVAASEIKAILERYKKYTVMGLSPNPAKTSHSVSAAMQGFGYDLVGVNPDGQAAGTMPAYRTLAEAPLSHRGLVNVFRRPEHIPFVVDEVLTAGGVEVLWLQLGIFHVEAERRAEQAGLRVISNHCIFVEYKKWMR